jgi:hypothetical protein
MKTIDSRWNDFSKRLEADNKFNEVMKSIEDSLKIENNEEHSRLKVPYVNASSSKANDALWQ